MRVRRRAKIRREGFTPERRFQLITGYDWFRDAYGDGGRFDHEAAHRDWNEHREEILEAWLQRDEAGRGGPGTRPWAWWAFDAPRELRRVVEGEVPWLPIENWPRDTSFGKPTRFALDPSAMRWEAEVIYLTRHGLVMPAERRALGMGLRPTNGRPAA